ncbi:hypothetical protein ACFL0H_03000 [Thermodesulfobacteriota bacterium]
MKIDMFTHLLTPKYGDAIEKHTSPLMKQTGPFGRDQGENAINMAIKSVTETAIPESDRKKIFEDNAKSILHLR